VNNLEFARWLVKSSREKLLQYCVEAETAREEQIRKEDERIKEHLELLDDFEAEC